jgi:hypothetical protein
MDVGFIFRNGAYAWAASACHMEMFVTFWPCFRLDLDPPDLSFLLTYLRSGSNAVFASHLKGVTREGKLMMRMDGDLTCAAGL